MISRRFEMTQKTQSFIDHNRIYVLIMLLMVMMFTVTAAGAAFSAEEEDVPVIRLSLEEAVARALKDNRDIQTARRSLSSAASSYRSAKAEYYPYVTIGYSGSQTVTKPDDTSKAETLYSSSAEINLSIPLDLSGAIGRSVQQALISLAIAKANYIETSQDLVVNVYDEYYNALSSAETLKINQAQVALAEEQLRTAQARFNSGRVAEVDVLTAKVQLNNEKQTLKASEGELDISFANLKNTLLLNQEKRVVLTSSLDYQPEYFEFQDALEESLDNRLEIEIARLNIESARIGLKSTYDPYRPNLNISGYYGYESSGNRVRDAFVDDCLSDPSWSVTTTINVPFFIFDGGVIRESTTQANLDLQQAKADLKQSREDIELEIKNVLTALENARDRVEIVRDSIELARESLRITELRYSMGKTSYLELVDGRNNLRTSELNLLSALIEHSLSKIQVYRALGRSLVKQ